MTVAQLLSEISGRTLDISVAWTGNLRWKTPPAERSEISGTLQEISVAQARNFR